MNQNFCLILIIALNSFKASTWANEAVGISGGGCSVVNLNVYYMGGYKNSEKSIPNTDIYTLDLSQPFKTEAANPQSNWKIVGQPSNQEKPASLFPNVISRGVGYGDIYYFGGKPFINSNDKNQTKELNDDSFWFLISKSLKWSLDSKSSKTASPIGIEGDKIPSRYLSTWITDPNDGDRMILYGGINPANYFKVVTNGTGGSEQNDGDEFDVMTYSNSLRAWEKTISNFNGTRRIDHCGASLKNQIYYVGGRYSSNAMIPMSDISVFDPKTKKFQMLYAKGDIPSPRLGANLIAIDNGLVLVGGAEDLELTKFPSEIYLLDVNTLEWSKSLIDKSNSYPVGYRACGLIVNNYMIFSNGQVSQSPNVASLQILDTNTWAFTDVYQPPTNDTDKSLPLTTILAIVIPVIIVAILIISITAYVFLKKRHKNQINRSYMEKHAKEYTESIMDEDLDIPQTLWEPPSMPIKSPLEARASFNKKLFTLNHETYIPSDDPYPKDTYLSAITESSQSSQPEDSTKSLFNFDLDSKRSSHNRNKYSEGSSTTMDYIDQDDLALPDPHSLKPKYPY